MSRCPALTSKQLKFIAEYLVDGNGARAAIAAGYGHAGSRVRAHRLTRDNVAVMAEIARRQAEDGQRLQMGRQEAIQGLLEAIDQARAQGNPAAMISGWKEIGRMMGFYEPERHEVVVDVADKSQLMARMSAMSDAELVAVMAEQGG